MRARWAYREPSLPLTDLALLASALHTGVVKKPFIIIKVTNETTRNRNYPVWEKFSVLQALKRLVHIVTTTLNGKYKLKV